MTSGLFPVVLRVGMGAVLFWATCLGWVLYFLWRAERGTKKPIVFRIATVAGGYASAMLGLLLFRQLEMVGIHLDLTHEELLPGLVKSSILIGTIEELCKFLPVLIAVRLSRCFDRPYEGLIFAACAGIGFSGAEGTWMWMQGELSWVQLLARAAAAPLTHALFSIPWGLGLSAFLFWGRSLRMFLGLLTSVLLHGTYDLMLASPEIPQIAAALVILALWLSVIRALTPALAEARRPLVHAPA